MLDWGIGELVPTAKAWEKEGRGPIRGKWVDRNKGDAQHPLVRSRYVACEINTYKDESLFAATPPLEALRLLLSDAATGDASSQPKKLLLIDVKKAHLHADAVREVYVSLPPELARKHPGMCWRLQKCLYGTRDAPAQWEALYCRRLGEMGFRCGSASRCCFYHPSRNVKCVVHGDDFTFSGTEENLRWVESRMKTAFACKVEGIMGPGPQDLKEARVLN